jgi:hypothetical protein
MSYLNALASSGLTVSLRFLPVNNVRRPQVSEAAPAAESLVPAGAAGPVEVGEAGRADRAATPPLSPEERAAGQAEARAQLAAEGVLGRLGLASPEAAASGAAPAEAGTEEEAEESQPAASGDESGLNEGAVKKLTPEEEAQVRKLAQRDQEVKAHEQAHVAASGGLAGSPRYEYQTGPDGRRYAVGGEVSIRRGGATNTDQALREAEAVKRGATAPAEPSSQDMAVAARAEADIQRLRVKKAQEAREGKEPEEGPAGDPATATTPAPAGEASESAGLPEAPMTPEKVPANGAGLGAQVVGAYAAVKLGFQNTVRPLLAQV